MKKKLLVAILVLCIFRFAFIFVACQNYKNSGKFKFILNDDNYGVRCIRKL